MMSNKDVVHLFYKKHQPLQTLESVNVEFVVAEMEFFSPIWFKTWTKNTNRSWTLLEKCDFTHP